MKPPIGFVFNTHAHVDQLRFVCQRLTSMFDRPPIAIHHDHKQTPVEVSTFPSNVMFVEDWVPTRWGTLSVVEGQHRALRLLYESADPDWFVLLSASDYPIQTAQFILKDLQTSGFDAFVDYRKIGDSRALAPADRGDYPFTQPFWERIAFERYFALRWTIRPAFWFGWKHKYLYVRSPAVLRRVTPFDGTVERFAGDHWLTGNRRAARAVYNDSPLRRKLFAHFDRHDCVDEGVNHCILGNTPGLKLCSDNKRYTDWTGCVDHPRTLGESDLLGLLDSKDHFARKFEFDPVLLKRIDDMVANK